MRAAQNLAGAVGVVAACLAMMVSRATFYRARTPRYGPLRPRPTPRRALSIEDRQEVLDVLHSEEFLDKSPVAVWATLLDRLIHLCSVRTMYRILASVGESRERRAQRTHPQYHKPELLATGPNQVWSWDITKLRGPAKWTYFYLFVVIDIFTRYVVGWMVADRENGSLAKHLLEETCAKEAIPPGQLIIHQDRGTPMTSKTLGQMYVDLSVGSSYSRPHVSDDNPYSESQFKTLKYRPDFPDRFGCSQDATAHCRKFFLWYNTEHRHSGIGYLTPETLHYGNAKAALAKRQVALDLAFAAHPERFVHGPSRVPALPTEAWINPPVEPALFLPQPHSPDATAGHPVSDDLLSPSSERGDHSSDDDYPGGLVEAPVPIPSPGGELNPAQSSDALTVAH